MRLGVLLGLLLLAGMVQAQPINLQIVQISLNENGHAIVQQLLSSDSTSGEPIEILALDLQNLRVFDAQGALEFQLNGNKVRLTPRLQAAQYGATISYETDQLTAKQGSDWSFALNSNALSPASETRVLVSFPQNAKVLSFEPVASVFSDAGKIQLEWLVKKENPVSLNAKYSFEEKPAGNSRQDLLWAGLLGIIVIVIAGIGGYYWKVGFKKKGKEKPKEKLVEETKPEERQANSRQEELLRFLTETEKRVMQELLKEGGITQRTLHVRTGLPKSTLSRTLQKLQTKELVEVREIGNTNRIELGKAFKGP